MNKTKRFKVASVSENTNSFGLYGMVIVAADGEAWQVGANSINKKVKGADLEIPVSDEGILTFATLGFEIPEQFPNCPPEAVAEIFA